MEQKTLFSNSFIRDSVISTLKHNSKDGDAGGKHGSGPADRYSDVSSELQASVTHTLNQPKLSSIDNKSLADHLSRGNEMGAGL